uniref:Uncharacterized protein n=1 Tax=Fagus sylvatica TaxID=28930 RepID=A0A2N9HR59_FAGSY
MWMGSVETVVVGEVSVKACLAWVGVELSVRMGLEVEGLGIVYGWGIFGEVQAGMIGKRAGHVRVGVFGGGAGEEAEVREARKLRSSHENIELLKEKLLEEKGRRERAEAELSKLPEFQMSMKKLEDELSSWKLMVEEIPGVSCSQDIPVKFATLQKEVIDSTMKVGDANARLKQLEVALDTALSEKQNAETEVALAKEKAEVSKSEVKRIELMLSIVTEERDKLRNLLNEFKRLKNDEAGDEIASGTLVQELESSLAKKELCIKELESSFHVQKEVNTRQYEEIKLLNERLNNEARRIKSLEREGDRLRSEVSLLESKLGHGDYSAANTKVLRMVNTLAVDNEAKQTIEALRTELQKTKEKLQAVEELKSQSGDAGALVDSYISGKITKLKEQIATLEKREERYKTVFADRISVFRRACCELFGYKAVAMVLICDFGIGEPKNDSNWIILGWGTKILSISSDRL